MNDDNKSAIRLDRFHFSVTLDRIVCGVAMTLLLSLAGCNIGFSHNKSTSAPQPTKIDLKTASEQELYIFMRRGKFGYINKVGQIVIPAKFDKVRDFKEGLATIGINDKFGCINKLGEIVIPVKYDYIGEFKDGLAYLNIDERYGFIDRTGKIVIPTIFESVGGFHEGLAAVRVNSLYGFINKMGEIVIKPAYLNYDREFKNGVAYVSNTEGKIAIDKTGKVLRISESVPESNQKSSKDLSVVTIAGKIGYADRTGKIVIAPRYDVGQILGKGSPERGITICEGSGECFVKSHDFDRGLAVVSITEKSGVFGRTRSGYIDKTGKMIFEF
jgi:hypothetical protein